VEILFLIGCSLILIGAVLAVLVKPIQLALRIYVGVLSAGLLFNLAFALVNLVHLPATPLLFPGFPVLSSFFRLDGLALFFLLIITSAAIPAILSTLSYLNHYLHKAAAVRAFLVSFSLVLLSTQLLVLANHAIVFLIFWELMTLMAYLGLLLEKEKPEIQKGSFIYFATTHFATFCLYIFFFLLHSQSGSWLFSDFQLTQSSGMVFYVAFFFGFVGFAIKAGFMPFHFWLPHAHSIAPTVLSAFLSAVIIKTGIYGIFRMLEFCSPLPLWIGAGILAISLFSAIFGVWYALAQHDIKKLLAYHSIENIGIIGIGIGLGCLGITYSIQPLIWLGLGGALFHTFNHAIFKSLLFLGSGVIYSNLHTRNIELMGGIVKSAPWFVGLFLIGSVAISGLPPLNGFMSEFLIYRGFFESASIFGGYFPFFMLLMTVGLAFVGGLALACFTKINSIMFLGNERSPHLKFTVTGLDYLSLGLLAFVCLLFGIYPQIILGPISSVVAIFQSGESAQTFSTFAQWNFITGIFAAIILLISTLIIWKVSRTNQRKSAAWGCGYAGQTSRMQYTASSYADDINGIAVSVLHLKSKVKIPETIFPETSRFHSHAGDFSEDGLVKPAYSWIIGKITSVDFLSRTDIRFYILFMLLTVLFYGGTAILWTYL